MKETIHRLESHSISLHNSLACNQRFQTNTNYIQAFVY
jgi:hypothetical protein